MSYVNSAGTRVDGPPVIEKRYQRVNLSESGAMPLFRTNTTERIRLADGRSVLWGGREHVEALQDVWVTLTPLAQKMVRELFPSVVELITVSYVSVVDVTDPVSGQTTRQRRDMGF